MGATRRRMGGPAQAAELRRLHPVLRKPQPQCLPSLSVGETRLLRQAKGPAFAGLRHEAFAGYRLSEYANP